MQIVIDIDAVALSGSQSTLDFYKWETQVYQNYDGLGTNYTLDDMNDLLGFERASNFYGGFDSVYQVLYDPALIQYREDVDMLFHLSSDDPPIYLNQSSTAVHPSEDLFHHSFHGREINDAALAANVSEVKTDIPPLSINTTGGETNMEFLERHLNSCSLTTPSVNLQIQLYLQGAYNTATNNMHTNLLDNNVLPTQQPFGSSPWNYNGSESVVDFSALPNTVDWILLDIRETTAPFSIIGQKAVLLQSDGSIIDPVSLAAGANLNMLSLGDNYEIIVRHRNHLDVAGSMSLIAATNNTYDFTNPNNVLGQTGQLADMGNGIYALNCGDMNGSGIISVADFNEYIANLSAIGIYTAGDCDLNGTVTVSDFNLYFPNSSLIGHSYVRY